MRKFATIAMLLAATPALAAEQEDCLQLWKTTDVNANGAIEREEDTAQIRARAAMVGVAAVDPDKMSRDEFMKACAANAYKSAGSSEQQARSPASTDPAAAPKDRGKGDLTPGLRPLAKEEAVSRLQAAGFKDVKDLSLDQAGIWRGSAWGGGGWVSVAIDQQGDIVSR